MSIYPYGGKVMSKKLYYSNIVWIILISSLVSCWILTFYLSLDLEYFLFYYTAIYLTLLALSIVCCLPLILLTDSIGKDWGVWMVWILKLANYHLPVFIASPLFMFSGKYPLFLEIPVIVLWITEAIIKRQTNWKRTLFITCSLYLIHIMVFIICLLLIIGYVSKND